MNEPSPWLRPLQFLAGGLGVAIVVLSVVWLRLEPAILPAARPSSATELHPDEIPILASDQTDAEPAVSGAPVGPAVPGEAHGDFAVLFGAVRRAGGEPVHDGVFWLYRDSEHVATASVQSGSYVFAGLPAGGYLLRSRVDDELPLNRDVVVRTPSTRVDIELTERWLLAVNVVTPNGLPLLEAVRAQIGFRGRRITACAFLEPLSGDLPPSNRAEIEAGIGEFRHSDRIRESSAKALPKQAVGLLTLPAGKPVHVALMARNHLVAQLPVTPGQEQVTFRIAAEAFLGHMATVRVRLVDRNGKPLVGTPIALNDAQTGGGGIKTGDDGRAVLQHVTPGRLDLEIRHRELRAPPVQVDVTAGDDLDLGDVILLPATRVEVAMDNFGSGRGGVRIHWLDTPPRGMTLDDLYVSSENQKSYPLSLYPGRYALLASAPNGVAILEVDLRTAPASPIRFDLQPGAPLRIDNRVGGGFARLELHAASGALVRQREFIGTSVQTVLLPPGDYRATITDGQGAVTRQTIALQRAGTTLTIR